MQSIQSSAFGIYFRNQPGSTLGTYAFLVYPDGTWQANVYDNQTGVPKQLKSGKQTSGGTNTGITLAIVVKGQNFSFYINNNLIGTTQDNTYSGGTVGIAVDHDGEISSDQFGLYAVAS
jgi:hypothetical protein